MVPVDSAGADEPVQISDPAVTVLRNPASGDVITEIGALDEPEVDVAIDRAAAAYESWREVAPGDRARLLRRFAAEVDR